jgi:hypothetical protein
VTTARGAQCRAQLVSGALCAKMNSASPTATSQHSVQYVAFTDRQFTKFSM